MPGKKKPRSPPLPPPPSNPTVPHSSSSSSSSSTSSPISKTDIDQLTSATFGITGSIGGYIHEIHRCLHLCRSTRTEENLLYTYVRYGNAMYKINQRHPLIQAIITVNYPWCRALILHSLGSTDIGALRYTTTQETLGHLVFCSPHLFQGSRYLPSRQRMHSSSITRNRIISAPTPFSLATRTARLQILRLLFTVPSFPWNTRNAVGCTSLYLAYEHGIEYLDEFLKHTDIVDFHLLYDCDVQLNDKMSIERLSLLHLAARNREKFQELDHMYRTGTNLNWNITSVPMGFTPFLFACTCDSIRVVKYFLTNNLRKINFRLASVEGYTGLMNFAHSGEVDIVRLLLENTDIDVNATVHESDNSALLCALSGKPCRAIVDLLLRHGADPNHQNQDGDTAVHFAVYRNDVASLRLLCAIPSCNLGIMNKEGTTPLFEALRAEGSLPSVDVLLDYPDRLRINAEFRLDDAPYTVLHCCIIENYFEHFKKIIAIPLTDLNLPTTIARFTPLMFSIWLKGSKGTKFAIELLRYVPHRVNVNIQDTSGFTALNYAIMRTNTDMVRRLLAVETMDFSHKIPDPLGLNYLQFAIVMGSYAIFNEVYKYHTKFNINEATKVDNTTVIMMACSNGFTDMVRTLLKDDTVDLTLTNNEGENLLIHAVISNNEETVREVLKYNHRFNVSHQELDDNSALHYAYLRHAKPGIGQALIDAGIDTTLVNAYDKVADDYLHRHPRPKKKKK